MSLFDKVAMDESDREMKEFAEQYFRNVDNVMMTPKGTWWIPIGGGFDPADMRNFEERLIERGQKIYHIRGYDGQILVCVCNRSTDPWPE